MRLLIAGDQRQGQPQPGPQVVRPAADAQPLAAWGSSASAATACAERRPPANTFCAQFVGHTVDTVLAKCHAPSAVPAQRWACGCRAGLPLERRRAVYMRHSPASLDRSPASLTLGAALPS